MPARPLCPRRSTESAVYSVRLPFVKKTLNNMRAAALGGRGRDRNLILDPKRGQHLLDARKDLVFEFREDRADHEITFIADRKHPLTPANSLVQPPADCRL